MQLMRKVHQLEEFELFQSLLPSTKQRLRDAQTSSCSRDDYRSFWLVFTKPSLRLKCNLDEAVAHLAFIQI